MYVFSRLCDECGEPATVTVSGMTGRVLIDNIDNNMQAADFCIKHAPRENERQPNDCKRVEFCWPLGNL